MAQRSTMRRMLAFMKRPESMLATAALGLAGAVGVLVMVTMASCQYDGSDPEPRSARDRARTTDGGAAANKPKTQTPVTNATVRVAGEPELRVRILTNAETVKVSAPGGLRIAPGDPRGQTSEPAALPGGSLAGWHGADVVNAPIVVSLRETGWTWAGTGVVPSRRERPGIPSTVALLIAPAIDGQLLTVNGAPFPGVLRLSARVDRRQSASAADGPQTFDVVEFVPLEEYLTGVVAKEMLANWPLGAYQAQAVAARTYALHERERSINAGQSFDLESSDRDQVYAGATTNRTAIQAVNSTRGVVLMDNDRVLRAYFSSTCGGRTAAARDTWPIGPGFEYNLAGPIQAHPRESLCNASPLYRWSVDRPRKELVQRLKTFGERNGLMIRQISDLKAIEPMSATPGGRPNRYKIIQPDGKWFQLSGEELRLACNTNITGNAVMPTGGAPATAAPEGSGNGRPAPSRARPGPSALADGRSRDAAPVLAAVATTPGADPTGPLNAAAPIPDIDRKTRVNSSDFEVRVNGEKVTFSGRGFGHGVGLCQYCAKAMAERGDDWRVMLARFYPGAKIVNLY